MVVVTDQKIQENKKLKQFLEDKVETAELFNTWKSLSRGSEIEGDGQIGSAYERVKKATVEGLEIKAFKDALGGSGDGQEPKGSELPEQPVRQNLDTRNRIIETLVRAGKKPEEITEYLDRLGPHLDYVEETRLPGGQVVLYPRPAAGSGPSQVKEIVEVVRMINETKEPVKTSPSQPSTAHDIVEAVKLGVELASKNQSGGGSADAYLKAIDLMKEMSKESRETMKMVYEDRLKHLEGQAQTPDIVEQVKKAKEVLDTLGMGTIDKEYALRKLDLDDKKADREHQWNLEEARQERQERSEAAKDKRQGKMLDRIMGGVETALESPVIKEAGKMVGSKLEGKVPDVRGQAARTQLTEPMQEIRQYTCPNCSKTTEFTNADLVTIANRGGRWVCPTQGCGKAYQLPKEGAAQK